MERVFVPKPITPAIIHDNESGWEKQIPSAIQANSNSIMALTKFVSLQTPRGPLPLGPDSTPTAVAKSTAVLVSWAQDTSGATVDFYSVWRADAGTAASPTTPTFASALRCIVIPSGGIGRTPTASVFKWFDHDFSTADRTAGHRFRYWVTSLDNESRESIAHDCGIVTVPP